MRVKHVAEQYSVTKHTVLAWIHSGELTAINVSRNPGGKPSWRISTEALAAFEASRMMTPPDTQAVSTPPRKK